MEELRKIIKDWKNSLTVGEFVTTMSLEILADRIEKELKSVKEPSKRA